MNGRCVLCKRVTVVETVRPTLAAATAVARDDGHARYISRKGFKVCQRCVNNVSARYRLKAGR